MTSTGKEAVTISVKGGTISSPAASDDITYNADKTSVTIAKDYTSAVEIKTAATVTELSLSGEMATLEINGGSALTTINFGTSKVGELTVSGRDITALNCSGLGLTKATISWRVVLSAGFQAYPD